MGIDVEIYYEADGEPSDLYLPYGYEVHDASDYDRKHGATHQIYTLQRYYGIGYERGQWPIICGVLMSLLASTNVKRVWYFGDCISLEDKEPVTINEILEISKHYMLNGERPYRRNAAVVSEIPINR